MQQRFLLLAHSALQTLQEALGLLVLHERVLEEGRCHCCFETLRNLVALYLIAEDFQTGQDHFLPVGLHQLRLVLVEREKAFQNGFVLICVLLERNIFSHEVDKIRSLGVVVVLNHSADSSNDIFLSIFLLRFIVKELQSFQDLIHMRNYQILSLFQKHSKSISHVSVKSIIWLLAIL